MKIEHFIEFDFALKPFATFIALTSLTQVISCAGGGSVGSGGGQVSSYSPAPIQAPSLAYREVPFHAPTRVGSVTPINSSVYEYDQSIMYSANLSGNGEDLILAGRSGSANQGSYPSYNLNIFSWNNGTLVNKTNQWFSGNDNVILATDRLRFADFDGDGKLDMYASSNTDTSVVGSGWVFFNNGSRFTRLDLNLDVHGHDAVVYDINSDGKADIFTTGSRVSFGNANRTFSTHTVSGRDYGGTAASVAIADFMGNNTSTILLTDQNAWQSGNNRLYSWTMVDGGRPTQDFQLSMIATLPDSRFLLPKWSGFNFTGSHDYRALAFDFDNSGLTSAVIFSRPVKARESGGYDWPDYNEIQFLKNRGGGNFIDVTDTTLIGFNTSTAASHYNPKLLDVNNDGLIDIVLGGSGWSSNTGPQVLIHTKEHKYVASYGKVFDAFLGQTLEMEQALNPSAGTSANGIVFIRGPDGSMYLATAHSYQSGGIQQKGIYLSKLGASASTAQATASLVKQIWPWMSDGQVNTVLAQSSTTWFGMNLLDPEKALRPIGEIGLPIEGRGLSPIRGYLTGIELGDANAVVTDTIGRNFNMNLKPMNINRINAFGYNTEHNDQYELTSHAEYLVNGNVTTINGLRVGTDYAGRDSIGMGLNKPTQYTVGVPRWYQKGNWSIGTQYTYLNTNPWFSFGGAWGDVMGSGITDNVVSYSKNGYSIQASAMHVSTNINPGLIIKVNNMWGGWAETGYRFGDHKREGLTGIYFGVKPVVLSGSVQARLPTGVDGIGNPTFTSRNLSISNQTTSYMRALHTKYLNKQTQLRISAIGTTSGQYRLMNQLIFLLD